MLQKKYGLSQESAIVSYSYTDFVQGRGYSAFYAGEKASGALLSPDVSGSCILSTKPFYSQNIVQYRVETPSTSWVGGYEAYPNMSFTYRSSPFNQPALIEGDIVANISLGIAGTNTGGCRLVPVISYYKLSDATETFIASGASTTGFVAMVGATTAVSKTYPIIAPAPLTHFKIGDVLKMNVEIWCSGSAVVTNPIGYGYGQDPMDRDDDLTGTNKPIIETTDTTTLISYIPFRIDI